MRGNMWFALNRAKPRHCGSANGSSGDERWVNKDDASNGERIVGDLDHHACGWGRDVVWIILIIWIFWFAAALWHR